MKNENRSEELEEPQNIISQLGLPQAQVELLQIRQEENQNSRSKKTENK